MNENIHDNKMSDGDHMDGLNALVDDRIRVEPRNATKDEEVRHFDKLEEDAKRELYPGCTDYSILKFVIEMLNVKHELYLGFIVGLCNLKLIGIIMENLVY